MTVVQRISGNLRAIKRRKPISVVIPVSKRAQSGPQGSPPPASTDVRRSIRTETQGGTAVVTGAAYAETVRAETNATLQDRLRALLPAAMVLALALALRLYRLGGRSLWRDEGASIRDAPHIIALNRMRPLYYLLLDGWMHFG